MKLWPFGAERVEERAADASATDVLIAAILARSDGSTASATATAALEGAAGIVGRAFASAIVKAPEPVVGVLGPEILAQIGRTLVRHGEIVYAIDVDPITGLSLRPCAEHEIAGRADPDTWRYQCTMTGPSGRDTRRTVLGDGVIHLRYAVDPNQPWRGIGPIKAASLAGKLSAETAAALADESSGPRGGLLPIPADGEDETVDKLKADIKNLKGKVGLVEGGDWDNPGEGRSTDWTVRRVGAEPPSALVSLHELATREIYAACGVSPSMNRETFRQFFTTTMAPLGKIVAAELSNKLQVDLSFDWSELRAADITGRARAFQSLVAAGMDLDDAAKVSGILIEDDGE